MKTHKGTVLPKEPLPSEAPVFLLRSHSVRPAYQRGGKPYYLCSARKRLIQATPEEAVRQAFLQFLVHVLKTPQDCVRAEVPMSYFQVGAVGRADIVLMARRQNGQEEAVAIIECKAIKLPILDRHLAQVEGYDTIIGAKLVIVTNGQEVRVRQQRKNGYQEIGIIPTYQQMVARTKFKVQPDPSAQVLARALPKPLASKHVSFLREEGVLGLDTTPALHAFIVNLHGLIEREPMTISTLSAYALPAFNDNGLRYESYGNAAGGTWIGNYRCFLLRHRGDDLIVSLAICAKQKRRATSAHGASTGTTMLCVSVDEGIKSHLSLQMALDRFTYGQGELVTIWHDGTLTNGNRGSVKRQLVLDYIGLHAPDLLNEEGQIVLGQVHRTDLLLWSQPATVNLIANLIRYALLRDDYRQLRSAISMKAAKAQLS